MNNFSILRHGLLFLCLLHICSGTTRCRARPYDTQEETKFVPEQQSNNQADYNEKKSVDNKRLNWEFPWLVSILELKEETDFIKSGTLIHPSVVVSGNHKYIGDAVYKFKVRAGKWRRDLQMDSSIFQERFIEKRVVYPRHHIWLEPVSIALYFLKTPFKIGCSPNIGVAHLNVLLPPADAKCLSVKLNRDYTVQKLSVKIRPSVKCEEYIASQIFLQLKLDSSALCASSEDLDLPYNDGTSSLVCQTENGKCYTLYGISALEINTLITQIPGVYNSISERFSWINEQVQNELDQEISSFIKEIDSDCDIDLAANTNHREI